MDKITVALAGLEYYGYHGLYPGENALGGKYMVDLEVSFAAPDTEELVLDQTLDYKKAYDLVSELFAHPTPLLENLAKRIAIRIEETFAFVDSCKVTVHKLAAPLGGIAQSARVCYERTRS